MTRPFRRLPRFVVVWLLIGAFVFSVYLVYRWAEPSPASILAVTSPAPVDRVSLELEDARFENFANGLKNWSLRAGRIRLERPTATGVANALLAADIENIQEGKFFASPEGRGKREEGRATNAQRPTPDTLLTQSSADAAAGRPVATFAAQNGRYMVSDTAGIPPDMLQTYTVLWQFRLSGDVRIRTREGYMLNAPVITMVELFNRHTGHTERQMLCPEGALVKAGGTQLQANLARYSDASQSVECQGGVRGTLRTTKGKEVTEDTIQSETMQWSLKDNVVSCPQTASGVWETLPYTATDVRIDVRRHFYTGKNLVMQIRETSKLAAGSLGLLMTTAAISQVPGAKQTASSAPPPGAGLAAQPEVATFKAADGDFTNDLMVGHNFEYKRGERTITGANGTYNKPLAVLDADGHLVMDDPEYHVTCQKTHVEEKKALAVLTGEVVMLLKPEKEDRKVNRKVPTPAPPRSDAQNASTGEDPDKGGTDNANSLMGSKKQGAIVTCDQVESYYKRKFNILNGHLTFNQKIERKDKPALVRTATAEHATYDAKAEILVLFPPVEGHDNDGGKFKSEKDSVTIYTHAGAEKMKANNFNAELPIVEEPDAEKDATPAKPGTPPDTKKPDTPTKK